MRYPVLLTGLLVLTLGAVAPAEMCVARWQAGDQGPHPKTVKVESAGDGDVITVDLSALPTETRVLRARLHVGAADPDLREPVKLPKDPESFFAGSDVCVLKAAYALGRPPQLADKPLPTAAPHHDCLDAAEAVRQWVGAGSGNYGFYVRNAPNWDKNKTCLEIAYEAAPGKVPPQAAGVAVLHRAGQTFITWKDADAAAAEDAAAGKPLTWGAIRARLGETDGPAVRYRVYRHDQPITARTIAQATLLAEVKPFSGYNINSWSLERLINQAEFSNEDQGELGKYGPFDGWTMWSAPGGKLMIDRFAIEDGKRLPGGTGLYVHSPDKAGKAHYAVTVLADGVENCTDFAGNVASADEQSGAWAPVRQVEAPGFGFDFRGQRQYYVAWTDQPLSPRPMYFNWSVHLPAAALDKDTPKDRRFPVELYFHGPGGSFARPPAKFIENSIQISPHDFPFSGWYGFNDAAGTLKEYAKCLVRPHTQRRIAAFMQWAGGKFPIDPARIIPVGGDGAALTALYQPQMCAYVLITGFEGVMLNPKAWAGCQVAWGPRSPDIKAEPPAAPLTGYGPDALAAWRWAELDNLLAGRELPSVAPKDSPPPPCEAQGPGWRAELPFFVIRGVTWGHDPGYVHGRGRFLYALQATGHGQCAHWAWGGRLVPPAKYTGLWQGVDFTNVTPFPAIAYSSADQEGEGSGNCNGGYTWTDVKDEADAFEVSISGPPSTFCVTPRRCQAFKPKAGDKVAYSIKIVPADARGGATTKPAEKTGELAADANGLVTLKAVELVRGAGCVTIRITKGK